MTTYETQLEKSQATMALVCLDFKAEVARRYVSPLTNRKPTLSIVVPFSGSQLDAELIERIRLNQQE